MPINTDYPTLSHMLLQLWHFDGFSGENNVLTIWTLEMLDVF